MWVFIFTNAWLCGCTPAKFRYLKMYHVCVGSRDSLGTKQTSILASTPRSCLSLSGTGKRLFCSPKLPTPGSGTHATFDSMYTGDALPRGLKRLKYEIDHSSSCSAEIKDEWSYTFTSPDVFMLCRETKKNYFFFKCG